MKSLTITLLLLHFVFGITFPVDRLAKIDYSTLPKPQIIKENPISSCPPLPPHTPKDINDLAPNVLFSFGVTT